jgi:predicted RNA methylase
MDVRLKRSLLKVLSLPLVQPIFWLACQATGQRTIWLSYAKNNAERRFLATLPSPPTVLAGPFKGLKYSVLQSVGSVLAPKILGTYELEIHPVWAEWQQNPYTQIIDIGCAEGYYAVGAALLWPSATISAYDIDAEALQLCGSLAQANKVADRVHIEGACTPAVIAAISREARTLILSDCEGYEGTLFTNATLPALANSDIIIEVHAAAGSDFMDRVEAATRHSHSVQRISAVARKAGSAAAIAQLSPYVQELILSENRESDLEPQPQWWLVLRSLQANQAT